MKKKASKKDLFVCNINLMSVPIEVRMDTFTGGAAFWFSPEKDRSSRGRIRIGVHPHSDWPTVVVCFLHECYEYAFDLLQRRYQHTGPDGGGSEGYLFVFNHEEFSRACESVGYAAANALPLLNVAFRKIKGTKK